MREIKFRAFDDGKIIHCPIGTNYGLHRFFGILNDEAIIMQFTGLKDKNGTDIYEGDILKHSDPKGHNSKEWEVIFYSGAFFMAGLPNKIRIYNMGDRLEKLEVIGNIHEN